MVIELKNFRVKCRANYCDNYGNELDGESCPNCNPGSDDGDVNVDDLEEKELVGDDEAEEDEIEKGFE